MIELSLFAKSVLLGLAIAAPLGPIGALCINRTLERGFAAGVAGGLGTALADACYAALAAIGFAAFAEFLSGIDMPMRLLGGLFLVYLGWRSFRPRDPARPAGISAGGLVGTVAATFVLTITSPMTILTFAAIFAGLGLASGTDLVGKLLVVAGVFTGSLLWWIILSGGVALLSRRLPPGFAVWIARASGAVLIGFGLLAIASLFWPR
jgi:putative LysE/RhtB family amino acid efflux pump